MFQYSTLYCDCRLILCDVTILTLYSGGFEPMKSEFDARANTEWAIVHNIIRCNLKDVFNPPCAVVSVGYYYSVI